MLYDVKSNRVRLTNLEAAELRRKAAANGEAVNDVRSQEELLEAQMKATPTVVLRQLVKAIERFSQPI